MSARQEIEALTRKLLAEKRLELTEKQRAFFDRIHENAPWKSWEKIPEPKLIESIDLCNRTLEENAWAAFGTTPLQR